jgi:hypothetical protein
LHAWGVHGADCSSGAEAILSTFQSFLFDFSPRILLNSLCIPPSPSPELAGCLGARAYRNKPAEVALKAGALNLSCDATNKN